MSRTSVVPDLIDAMVSDFAALSDLSGVEVSDGLSLTNEPGTYLYVGVDDPEGLKVSAADADQTWPHATAQARNEEGSITLAVESINGDGAAKDARDEVYRVAGAIQDRLCATPTLGVPGVLWTSFANHRLEQAQSSEGASALITFRITFTARI